MRREMLRGDHEVLPPMHIISSISVIFHILRHGTTNLRLQMRERRPEFFLKGFGQRVVQASLLVLSPCLKSACYRTKLFDVIFERWQVVV